MVSDIQASDSGISKSIIAALACISALLPFAIDLYLPAIPQIAVSLDTNVEYVAMTVSLFIFGIAFGQLIGGFLSDKYGRKQSMYVGLLLFTLSSLYILTIHDVFGLWIGRVIQSLGSGIALVGINAVIRDCCDGKTAARAYTLIEFIGTGVPAVAPIIGTFILLTFNWLTIFIGLTGYGILALVLVKALIPNRQIKRKARVKKASEVKNPLKGYLEVMTHKKASRYLWAMGLYFAAFMTFIANSSVIYVDYFKQSEQVFSLLAALSVILMLIINKINQHQYQKRTPEELLKAFSCFQMSGVCILVLSTVLAPDAIVPSAIGFTIVASSHAGIVPNLTVIFMGYFKEHAGLASGIYGASRFLMAGLVSGFAAFCYNGTLVPLVITIALFSFVPFTLLRMKSGKAIELS